MYSTDVNSVINLLQSLCSKKSYQTSVAIDNYNEKIAEYYSDKVNHSPIELCNTAKIPFAFGFQHFGIINTFEQATQLNLYDEQLTLASPVKELIKRYGVVIFKNAYLPEAIRNDVHMNNFAHLNFHRDRHDSHDNCYSIYQRNPFDKKQYEPRTASTLFIDNSVAYLQGLVENLVKPGEEGRRGHYEIFRQLYLAPLLGNIILEQNWSAPAGTGELCVINNRQVLHSSYKRDATHGYPIGTRYLF